MTTLLFLALALILAGLLMCWLAPKTGISWLTTVVFWAGIILVVVGLVLLLTPVLVWLNAQLRAMLGV